MWTWLNHGWAGDEPTFTQVGVMVSALNFMKYVWTPPTYWVMVIGACWGVRHPVWPACLGLLVLVLSPQLTDERLLVFLV